MFASDLPFPQAISALADCYEAAAAGTFPYVICFGRRHGDCCAIAILFWPAGAIPDCRAAIFLFAGAIRRLPRRIFWPARSANCCAVIFL